MKLKNSMISIAAFYVMQMVKELSSVVGTYVLETYEEVGENDNDEEQPEWKRKRSK